MTIISEGVWHGRHLQVAHDVPCPTPGHDLVPVDHYGTPTEWLACYDCQLGLAIDPDAEARIADWQALYGMTVAEALELPGVYER